MYEVNREESSFDNSYYFQYTRRPYFVQTYSFCFKLIIIPYHTKVKIEPQHILARKENTVIQYIAKMIVKG